MDGSDTPAPRLGEGLSLRRMPAHWMLGRLGKTVMRPGGLGPSQRMIDTLGIGPDDDVVEMWPGLGRTTTLALVGQPRSYVGIERGQAEAVRARTALTGPNQQCTVAPVHRTGLPDHSASVLFGEALLTLEPASRKTQTVAEAARLLRPGGRYGIHELLLTPEGLSDTDKADIQTTLTSVLHVGARPLTHSEWRQLLTDGGFTVRTEETCPLLLLDPRTVLADEGPAGTAAILGRALTHPTVLPRLVKIWRTFHRYRDNLGAITLVAERTDSS
ncbi:methyltransferase domain-containing protein (plasmid) [Rhodococcus pseudokoreensis]|uniref:Methyltransferase domain-containing protein n=1 Tax=Rhodococcus pseudokoreensis TaxID=2811421 RepID=A0A974ZRL5_9NOCA|nr:methyltransferase domain-containing protein [Rhodococcus pseudokoreensis]QSE87806.1 methyltransferase domain-containing protein [Rhodococcus pseudokoreensis]